MSSSRPLPPALDPGATIRIVAPASPASPASIRQGIAELRRLGYQVQTGPKVRPDGYFASSLKHRVADLQGAITDSSTAIICTRGGYGSGALLDALRIPRAAKPKLVVGFSDITALQIYLWQQLRWPSLHGPMVAAGFDHGAGRADGYDSASFLNAASGMPKRWAIDLGGETLVRGEASGLVLGGCLTLIQTSLATSWDLDTRGSILLIEDRAVRPYQLDRMLLHLAQAGKFRGVRGIILGEFPDAGPPQPKGITIRDVCRRMLGSLGIPVVFGAAFGHTPRPVLTIPLGVRGRLIARGAGKLEILEPVVATSK